ncbi:hypothetical protein ACFLT9_01770 [Acidobacteriota bacterium]
MRNLIHSKRFFFFVLVFTSIVFLCSAKFPPDQILGQDIPGSQLTPDSGQGSIQATLKPMPPIWNKSSEFQPFSYNISLKGANGKYVSADGGLNGLLVSNRDEIGEWERFEIFVFEGKKIALKAWNGRFVAPDAEGDHRLYATALNIDKTSTFLIDSEKESRAVLLSSEGKFVAADLDLGGVLMANRDKPGSWEWFEIERINSPPQPRIQLDEELFIQRTFSQLSLNLEPELDRSQSRFQEVKTENFLQKQSEKFVQNPYRVTPKYESGPKITRITADLAHAEKTIMPGNWYFIEGQGFGTEKGTITVVLDEAIQGEKTYRCDPQSFSWKHDLIAFRVPLIHGLRHTVRAKLVINHKKEDVFPGSCPIEVDPRRIVYQISGRQYFNPAPNDRDFMSTRESNNRKIMGVVHDPGCGWIGDDGIDMFDFSKLPQGCTVEKMVFFQSIPSKEGLAKSWLENHITEIFLAIAREGIGGLIGYAGKVALEYLISLVDSDAGKYAAYIMLEPNKSNPIAMIRWHNTCWSVYDDLPLVYVVTFFITGPEGLTF